MGFFSGSRRRWQRLAFISLVFCLVSYTILGTRDDGKDSAVLDLPTAYPLSWDYVHRFNGTGGGQLPSTSQDILFLSSFVQWVANESPLSSLVHPSPMAPQIR